MASSDASERLALIRENLAEVLNAEIIEKVIAEVRLDALTLFLFGMLPWRYLEERSLIVVGTTSENLLGNSYDG